MTHAHRLARITVVVIILVCAATAAVVQRAPVDTVEFYADSVARVVKYNIILPLGYGDEANHDRDYPTLYLLHGAGGNFKGWPSSSACRPIPSTTR